MSAEQERVLVTNPRDWQREHMPRLLADIASNTPRAYLTGGNYGFVYPVVEEDTFDIDTDGRQETGAHLSGRSLAALGSRLLTGQTEGSANLVVDLGHGASGLLVLNIARKAIRNISLIDKSLPLPASELFLPANLPRV